MYFCHRKNVQALQADAKWSCLGPSQGWKCADHQKANGLGSCRTILPETKNVAEWSVQGLFRFRPFGGRWGVASTRLGISNNELHH